METLIKILIKEHEQARKILSEIEEIIKQLNRNPKEPKEKFEALINAISLIHLLSEFSELTIKHKNIEEYSIYPKLKDLGYDKEIDDLIRQHEAISEFIKEISFILDKYKSKEKRIEEILSEIINVYEEVSEIYVKHMEYEERMFSKIVKRKIKVKEKHYLIV